MNEAFGVVGGSATEAAAQIASWIAAFRNGGPNRRAESLELGRKWSLALDKINDRWDEVEEEVEAKSAKLVKAEAGASFKDPEPQPIREAERPAASSPSAGWAVQERERLEAKWAAKRATGAASKLEAAVAKPSGSVVRLIAKQQAEPEEEPKADEPKEAEPEAAGPARLNLAAPYNVAKTFVKRSEAEGKPRYAFVGKVQGELVRMPTLLYWQKEFYRWNGQCYEAVEEDDVKAQMYEFLDRSVELDGRVVLPRSKNVNEILDALQSGTKFSTGEVPAWIGVKDRPAPKGLLACRNGLLEFDTGNLWDHDPRFFGLNKVDFDFDPRARAPRWEQFLGELWPGDAEAIGTLQEFFGLWVTEVTKFHKACVLIGPPRCGKGTIGRVVKGFLGNTSFAAVSLQTLGTDQFGMEHLIGKKLALVPDVKLDGRANVTLVMERLLTTIGEDEQAINRKNKKYWLGTLGIRWVILGNDVPKFRGSDEAGALVKRCVMLEMREDFFGREDFDLTEKLLAERAGILNWAMEGWRRLRERDRFVQPRSGMGLLGKLQASTSTMGAFIDDCCELGPEEKVLCDGLWSAFKEWSERRRLSVTLSKNTFSGALHRVFPSVVTSRPGAAANEDGRPRWFFGVKLRNGWRDAWSA